MDTKDEHDIYKIISIATIVVGVIFLLPIGKLLGSYGMFWNLFKIICWLPLLIYSFFNFTRLVDRKPSKRQLYIFFAVVGMILLILFPYALFVDFLGEMDKSAIR